MTRTEEHTTPGETLREMAGQLDGYQLTEYRQGRETLTLPDLHAETDGVTLTLRCGERRATLTLHEAPNLDGGALIGDGGFVLPRFLTERWHALAAVLPMEERPGWNAFGLADLAVPLGYRVLISGVPLRFKYFAWLSLLRLEHQDHGEVWGCVYSEETFDGSVSDILLLGGLKVAHYRIEATCDDHALAGMSDADIAAENLWRPDPSVFRDSGTPLTQDRLNAVLNAVHARTAHTLYGKHL